MNETHNLEWKEEILCGRRIYLSKIDECSYLVASIGLPRFCFQASTPDEARATVSRALTFYDAYIERTKLATSKVLPPT